MFFPARYLEAAKWDRAEEFAAGAGQIGYVHFDAKYRIETIERLLGADDAASARTRKHRGKVDRHLSQAAIFTRCTLITTRFGARRDASVLYPGRDGDVKREYTRYEEVSNRE